MTHAGTAPEPNNVQLSGISPFQIAQLLFSEAPERSIPCPAKITGLFALAMRSTASPKLFLSISLSRGFPGSFTGSSGK